MPSTTAAMPDERIPWLRSVPAWLISRAVGALWGFEVSGLENVPASGPVIVAANHVSLMDGPALVMAVGSRRCIRFLGKQELFRVPLLGWYLRHIGMIPLNRSGGDVVALRSALDLLRAGGSLGLFPEGHRSKDGRPGRPKGGVGFLAGQTGAAVIPARLRGTDTFPRRGAVRVRFGSPLAFRGDPEDHRACLDFAGTVMERIFDL